MKHFCFILGFIIATATTHAQTCTLLGCAKNYGTINTTNAALTTGLTAFECITESRQFYWQFVYSPSGGNLTQTFTAPAGKDVDWAVWDLGASLTLTDMTCPIIPDPGPMSPLAWYCVGCDFTTTNLATGPGIENTVPTLAYHYYAILVSAWSSGNWSFTIGTPQIGGSNLSVINCSGLLPVKLESFEATKQDSKVLLNWKISNEINVSHYEVQYSIDGRNFTNTGNIAAGNRSNYTFIHDAVNIKEKLLYYRLKTVDVNGSANYSSVIKIQFSEESHFYIMTNPVGGNLNINGLKNRGQIKIIDLSGKVLLEKTVQSQSVSIPVAFIKTGTYILQYIDGSNAVSQKFIKQ